MGRYIPMRVRDRSGEICGGGFEGGRGDVGGRGETRRRETRWKEKVGGEGGKEIEGESKGQGRGGVERVGERESEWRGISFKSLSGDQPVGSVPFQLHRLVQSAFRSGSNYVN